MRHGIVKRWLRTFVGFMAFAGLVSGCSPAQFHTDWDGEPDESAMIYGCIHAPGQLVGLVSVYKIGKPMFGYKGLGDPGEFNNGSFVVCALPAGSGYFVQGFWIGDDMYELAKIIPGPLKLRAGEMHYIGSWEVESIHHTPFIPGGSYTLKAIAHPSQAEILKTFLKDPTIARGWAKKIRAELARI